MKGPLIRYKISSVTAQKSIQHSQVPLSTTWRSRFWTASTAASRILNRGLWLPIEPSALPVVANALEALTYAQVQEIRTKLIRTAVLKKLNVMVQNLHPTLHEILRCPKYWTARGRWPTAGHSEWNTTVQWFFPPPLHKSYFYQLICFTVQFHYRLTCSIQRCKKERKHRKMLTNPRTCLSVRDSRGKPPLCSGVMAEKL